MVGALEQGREQYGRGAWAGAYEALSRADQASPLAATDLELLARAAYLLGRDDDYVSGLERAHQAHLEAGDVRGAVRCAFWIGHNLVFRGEQGPAEGWFARAQRLLEAEGGGGAEAGYLRIPVLLGHIFGGDAEGAESIAAEIASIGQRFGDPDLVALGMMEQGHARVRQGRVDEGLRLVDESMVAVTTGELSPIVSGIVYCQTISFCRSVFELRRARDWTAALTRWCEQQPEMVAHNGLCLVHRAELMTLGGAWPDALKELHRLGERFTRGALNELARGDAAYQRGEVLRLRGELADAEEAYREASRLGREPQPGLALLRLAQGDAATAAAAIRRAVSETTRWPDRAALLPAYVEITLAVEDLEAARSACRELAEIAERQHSDVLRARSAQAEGSVALAEGDVQAALGELRQAWRAWQALDAPHDAARMRVLVAACCRALGDEDTATLHLEAARRAFQELGAEPDLRALEDDGVTVDTHGLTDREIEVVREVAAGHSNRQIAETLFISEHTVARHLQNVFAKLGVSSRTAVSAYAYEHGLIRGRARGQD